LANRKTERIETLAEALAERRVLHVKDAAALLGVSEMTVRRDVADYPQRFAFLGGHVMPAPDVEGEQPYELARATDAHASAKRAACRHAVRHIRDGDTVFLDCGSTLIHLIDLIPEDMNLTVVCYAMNVGERLARKSNVKMIMLGGLYHRETASFSGSPGLEVLDHLGINIAFLSAAGVDFGRGASCMHFHEVPVKQKVIALAQRRFLVADKSKFGIQKPAFFAELRAFDALITESGETGASRGPAIRKV
jgi:DeoR family transcriptional regulator, deoxyribose operon repressor